MIVDRRSNSHLAGRVHGLGYPVARRMPCCVCGLNPLHREGWFLVAENRWLDRLRIFYWNPSLAARHGFKSACGREHLKTLIAFWLDQANLRLFPRATALLPVAGDPGRESLELVPSGGRLVGELSVCREAHSRTWTGSPSTLESIVDALIPLGESDEPMASGFQLLRSSHDPPYGLSLH